LAGEQGSEFSNGRLLARLSHAVFGFEGTEEGGLIGDVKEVKDEVKEARADFKRFMVTMIVGLIGILGSILTGVVVLVLEK
jgi:hypothetical protein